MTDSESGCGGDSDAEVDCSTRLVAARVVGPVFVARVMEGDVTRKRFAGFTRRGVLRRGNLWLAFNDWPW